MWKKICSKAFKRVVKRNSQINWPFPNSSFGFILFTIIFFSALILPRESLAREGHAVDDDALYNNNMPNIITYWVNICYPYFFERCLAKFFTYMWWLGCSVEPNKVERRSTESSWENKNLIKIWWKSVTCITTKPTIIKLQTNLLVKV